MFRKLDVSELGKGTVSITIDGLPVAADKDEAVAAVLLRTPPFTARTSPISGAKRAPFCMMGACFECLVEVDGRTSMRGCMTPVRDGMVIHRQAGRPDPVGVSEA